MYVTLMHLELLHVWQWPIKSDGSTQAAVDCCDKSHLCLTMLSPQYARLKLQLQAVTQCASSMTIMFRTGHVRMNQSFCLHQRREDTFWSVSQYVQ